MASRVMRVQSGADGRDASGRVVLVTGCSTQSGADGRDASGRVVLVTGCSTGIGHATAIVLAREGDRVFASMRNVSEPSACKCMQAHTVIYTRDNHVFMSAFASFGQLEPCRCC
jgi:NADPH:quinone reductase-like Zn-dependent oxidoreductase